MGQFAASLRDVGRRVRDDFGGRFLAPAERVAWLPDLAAVFAGWESFSDVSTYRGRAIPLYKRAQLAAADLQRAGVATLPGRERLTAFADNLVPHVLRVDGVLQLEPGLTAAIDTGELLPHGSPQEVELRAVAVHAVELLAAENRLAPVEIDELLWNRGRGARYKSRPRPRSRTTAY
jgi:putative queuosine salvage protein